MSNEVNICPTCHRTDAFTPGQIDHDKQWHQALDYMKQFPDDRQYRANLEKMRIELR